MAKNHTEGSAVLALKDKNDIQIVGHEIQILTGKAQKGDLGIKSKGKIDFLTKNHGYVVVLVDKFQR